jgi:Maltogenic Amylase, C-terminal domain
MIDVPNSAPQHVLSFVRQDEHNKVFALFNFSQQKRRVTFANELSRGSYTDFATGQSVELQAGDAVELPAWGYKVLTR